MDAVHAERDALHPPTLIGGVKYLRLALDWLEWHAQGTLSDEGRALLDHALPLDEWDGLEVGFGAGFWSYRVRERVSGIVLLLNSQGCQIRLSGTPLTLLGTAEAVARAEALAARFGLWFHNDFATRVDVAVDLGGYSPRFPLGFTLTNGRGRKPKPTFHGLDLEDSTFETVSIGRRDKKGAGVYVIIYNKLTELQDKVHAAGYQDALQSAWALNGWDGSEEVRRLEVSLLRPKMQSNGITRLGVMEDTSAALVLGLGWVTPTQDAATVAVWEELRSRCPMPERVKAARLRHRPDEDSLTARYVRLVADYAALFDTDFDGAAQRLFYGAQIRLNASGAWDDQLRTSRHRYGVLSASQEPF